MRKQEQEETKTCGSCKYYFAHYIRKDGYYIQTINGHCVNKTVKDRFKETDKICECFDEISKEEEKAKDEKTIKTCLERIEKGLEELVRYLEGRYI